MFRTHTCNQLTKKEKGQQVILSGWVNSRRDHGGVIFIDLRDRYGLTQVAFDPKRNKEAWEIADAIRPEYVVKVTGTVSLRPEDMINKKLFTGEIEIDGFDIEILSKAKDLPFVINEDKDANVNEDLRLEYRYLDLRRARLQKNLMFRAKVIKFMRDWMTKNDFVEVETPILSASSPEGARDFLVPSRLHKGKFYALPQAPQQYKQLLMVAGLDRYFQIAPCFRDEDARADRSPGEFYQLDIEASFMEQNEFLELIEPLFISLVRKLTDKKLKFKRFPKIKYWDAMNKYGSDKPDLRYGYELHDLTDFAKNCGFEVFKKAEMVKGICINKGTEKIGRNLVDTELAELAKKQGAKGLAWMKMTANGLESSISKFFTKEELSLLENEFDAKEGDLIFFTADKPMVVFKTLGAIRQFCAKRMGVIDDNEIAFAWIVDFPMFEYNEDLKKMDFCHNPFSMPQGGLESLRNEDPLDILAYQYDIVCNGVELSSGAVRNFDTDIMYKAFEIAGYAREDVDKNFKHMIKAFSYGAPPHCGIAPGIERTVMILLGETNIREVTAFPKNSKAMDLVVGAPGDVEDKQLKELGIKKIS